MLMAKPALKWSLQPGSRQGVDRGRLETLCAGHAATKAVAIQRNSGQVRLGVKWSQVQILSARPEKEALACDNAESQPNRRVTGRPQWGPDQRLRRSRRAHSGMFRAVRLHVMHAMRAHTRYPAQPGCCPCAEVVRWSSGVMARKSHQCQARVRELVAILSASDGLGPARLGDRTAHFAMPPANDFRRGGGFHFPPSALRANAAAAGLTIFRSAWVTGWSVTLTRTWWTGSWRRGDSEIDRPSE